MNVTRDRKLNAEEKPKLVIIIKNAHDARLAVFERVSAILNQEYLKKVKSPRRNGVWDASDMVPYVNGDYGVGINSLMFECDLGGTFFKYSIALSLGEVRLGIVVPALKEGMEALLSSVEAYPYASKDPQKVIRSIASTGCLIDHIYNDRFGSLQITKAALESRMKGSVEIDTIGDALARELIHLNHSLMHAIINHGFLVLSDNIYSHDDYEVVDLCTAIQPASIAKLLEINSSQIFIRGRHEYGIMIPNGSDKIKAEIDAMNTAFYSDHVLISEKG